MSYPDYHLFQLKYLRDYVDKFKIKIHYNTNIEQIVQDPADSSFSLFTSTSDVYNCKYVVARLEFPGVFEFLIMASKDD